MNFVLVFLILNNAYSIIEYLFKDPGTVAVIILFIAYSLILRPLYIYYKKKKANKKVEPIKEGIVIGEPFYVYDEVSFKSNFTSLNKGDKFYIDINVSYNDFVKVITLDGKTGFIHKESKFEAVVNN